METGISLLPYKHVVRGSSSPSFVFAPNPLSSAPLPQTRDFFAAFFTLSDFHWHGFLSTRLSFTQLVGFGLSLFVNASNDARGNLLAQGVPGECCWGALG